MTVNKYYTIKNDYLITKRKRLSIYLKVCAADWDRISHGIEFHKNGAATKKNA